ncbi:(d)CMP kinase [Oceanobacillus sp. FSL H7-0719]|uniref:(d)CMP kinase n=1 Tax=Oceanobacillus sp. FSL H7-0719 TaxID=2954507 RepID=UPI003254B15B
MRDKKTAAIAIDGPAAAGKSTVAKIVAEKLNYIYIDTGAMYRALTLKALNKALDLSNEKAVLELLLETNIELKNDQHGQRVFLDSQDVTEEIRYQEVSTKVSYIAKLTSIRKEMVKRQQDLAKNLGVVMDGRDIGTHVLPDAEVKIFLIASVDERAKRRHDENISKGLPSELEQLKKEIQKRDEIDSNRETAPLVKAEDAIEVNTTALSIDEVVHRILEEVKRIEN